MLHSMKEWDDLTRMPYRTVPSAGGGGNVQNAGEERQCHYRSPAISMYYYSFVSSPRVCKLCGVCVNDLLTHLGALSFTPSNAAFRAAFTRFSVDF
jgi:hypothetical protein